MQATFAPPNEGETYWARRSWAPDAPSATCIEVAEGETLRVRRCAGRWVDVCTAAVRGQQRCGWVPRAILATARE